MKRNVFCVALAIAALIGAHAAQAVQSVYPASDAVGTPFAGGAVTKSGGQPLVFYGRYTSDNPNESGLGLKIQFDPAKIEGVTVDQVLTKCIVSFPPDQSVLGEVIFAWADTSVRPDGAVGWTGSVDGAPPISGGVGCITLAGPPAGYVQTTAAFPPPTNLFRFTATTAAGFTSGSTSIALTSTGGGPFTATSLQVNGSVAPPCTLDVDGNGTRQPFVDGILIVRHMLGITGTNLTSGLTIPGPNNTAAVLQPIMAGSNYDIDGSGTTQAFVDGIILVRLMLGITDANLLSGITLPGTAAFTTASAIRANVNTTCGTSF